MVYKDLREFLDKLKAEGEAIDVKAEVDWDMEMGAINRLILERGLPATIFTNIKDYPGWRVACGHIARGYKGLFTKIAMAFGLKPDASFQEICEHYSEVMRPERRKKPVLVKSGPCKEKMMVGDEVDLYKLPAPVVHAGDGGRYILTYHANTNKDPDTGWVNWGMYRGSLVWKGLTLHYDEIAAKYDIRKLIRLYMSPPQHGRVIADKYAARGEDAPMANFMGGPPSTMIATLSDVPAGVSEAEVAGGIEGEPLEQVKCETIDVEVPATCEINIEGRIRMKERVPEGPFCEYVGYRSMPPATRLPFIATAVTWRENAIFTMSNMGYPIDEWAIAATVFYSASLYQRLKEEGFPVRGVYWYPSGNSHFCIISTEVPHFGYVERLASFVFGTKAGTVATTHLVIVNEDIDPTNIDEVIWAIATRNNPERGIVVRKRMWVWSIWPAMSPPEKMIPRASKVVIDATWPASWPRQWVPLTGKFETIYPDFIKKRVLDRWEEYGLPKEKKPALKL